MSKIKRLAGETILYGLGSMLPKFLNFLLVRLHTDVFPPEEFGIVTKLLGFVAVLNVIYTFGMETAYFRFATREGADERDHGMNVRDALVHERANHVIVVADFEGREAIFADTARLIAPGLAALATS